MSEPHAEDGHGAAPVKKKKGKLMFMMLAGMLLGGGALGGYFFFIRKAQAAQLESADKDSKKEEPEESPAKMQIVTLKPIIVNLRNTKGTRFLKVTMGIQTASQKAVNDLTRMSPQIADFLVNKLSDLEVTDIDNLPGRTKLKREILNGINEVLDGGYISGVYFTEFVIQ